MSGKYFSPDQPNLPWLQVARDFSRSTGNVSNKRTNHRTAFVSVDWGGQTQADLEWKRWVWADDGRLADASLTSQLNHLQTKSQGQAGSAASDWMRCVSLVEGHWFMGCWSSEADGTDPTTAWSGSRQSQTRLCFIVLMLFSVLSVGLLICLYLLIFFHSVFFLFCPDKNSGLSSRPVCRFLVRAFLNTSLYYCNRINGILLV